MDSLSQQVETALNLTATKNQPTENETRVAKDQPDYKQETHEVPTSQSDPTTDNPKAEIKQALGTFLSFSFTGSLECGADWILATGVDVGITQIARCKVDEFSRRHFVWNHPISLSYRSYNFYGWPQIILSVYYFDLFGSDQLLGYGCAHLPVSPVHTSHPSAQLIKIYSPQATSFTKQLISWITREKPQLVDSSLFGRGDLRSSLQMLYVGQVELRVCLTSKDVGTNGYRNHS